MHALFRLHERAQLAELLLAKVVALASLDAIEQIANECRELERVERLRHVVDAADVEPARTVAKLCACGEEDDRDVLRVRVVEQVLCDPPAVERRHHHVEEDDVRIRPLRLLEPGRTVLGLDHFHLFGFEIDPAEKPDRSLVVDHEHSCQEPSPRELVAIPLAVSSEPPCAAAARGSSNVKCEPLPSSDSTLMCPPIFETSPRAMNSPRPVPEDVSPPR